MSAGADSIIRIQPEVETSPQFITADSSLFNAAAQREEPVFRFSDGDTSASQEQSYSSQTVVAPLFEGHQLRPVNSSPIPVYRRTPDWFTITLIFVIFSFSWIRVFYSKIFKQLISAFYSNSISNQVVRDENILVQRASVLMSFIFYLTASLFIYQISVFYNWDYPFLGDNFLRFLVLSLIVSFAYSFKMVLLKALGEVFELDRPVASYIFNIFLINNMLGLILLPVVVTIAFVVTYATPLVIYTGVVLVIIAFIYRLVRAFTIWMTLPGVSIFYLILYFCTLEIAPLLIIVKLAWG